jgi:tRNA threonylcarbamoyladenosine biosynthesis protein TsaB
MDEPLQILAIESSGREGSVALLEGRQQEVRLVELAVLGGYQRTAQALAPAIRDLLSRAGWPPTSITLVSVTVGPGSFTGLRIGVTTAKTFAYAVSADIVGVNTHDVLAAQAPASAAPLWTILDAQRQELFVARYTLDTNGEPSRTVDSTVIPQDEWLSRLQSGDQVIGPALKRLAARLPRNVVALPQATWMPMAETVGRVAWRQYQAGCRDDVWKLTPEYYRPSAAEEKFSRRTTS